MLDVACGTGNLTLPAARAGVRVTGIDIAPALVAQLAARAVAEGLTVDAREGDAEELPVADGSFDTVVTMFGAKVVVGYVPPAPGMPSVLLWGDPDAVRNRLGAGVTVLRAERRPMVLEYPVTPAQTVELFRTWYGPTVRAFAALDEERQGGLFDDLVRLWTDHNTAGPHGTRVESEFLEVVATRA